MLAWNRGSPQVGRVYPLIMELVSGAADLCKQPFQRKRGDVERHADQRNDAESIHREPLHSG